MPSTAAESPQMDWEFPDHHEAAWTWPENNPHAFQVMDDVIPFRSPKGEIKLCPNCGRTVRFSIGMCPLCGYDEEDWQMPEHIAAAWDNYQDPREPFVDQSGQYHSQCEQCGELIDGPVCEFCGHQQTTQDPQTLLNHQPRGPMDRAGEWTFPEHWGKTAIRNPFGDEARGDRRREKFDKSYQKHVQKRDAETLARDAEKSAPLLKGLWDAAYHHNVAPESLYLNHTYGQDGKSWYSPQPQAQDYFPGWSNHLQSALKNLGPEWYSNWHQQYQQQKAQEHAANPDSMSHEHEDWLDWYAKQAPEHFDPHTYDPATATPRPTPPEAYYQVRERQQRQQEAQQPPRPQQSVQPKPYQPDQSVIFNNPSLYSRTTTKEAGPADWANRFLRPEFKPQPENMQGLPGHCSFHPDRPAVAHEGFASMCVECLDRYRAAQQAVGH